MSSFEKINYNLRPNKCIERKMMCEALIRLSLIDHISNYRYIGFGSPYFADFVLFHKLLGINDLVSIEKEEEKKERFKFNIPYACINMHFGMSSTILPNLELDKKKNILWLDYDGKISDFMFSDINTFFLSSQPGSFFMISINVEAEPVNQNTEVNNDISLKEYRLSKLIERIGRDRIPSEFMNLNMSTQNLTSVTHELIDRQIYTTLSIRNGKSTNKISYKQILNFLYKDGATILTIGGILYDNTQKNQVEKMRFQDLPFYKSEKERFKIQTPNLTFKEINALDNALPSSIETINGHFKNNKLKDIPLLASDIKNYSKVYRYYPKFVDVNL